VGVDTKHQMAFEEVKAGLVADPVLAASVELSSCKQTPATTASEQY